MQNVKRVLCTTIVLLGAVGICKAEDSLEAKLAKLQVAVKAHKSARQSVEKPEPVLQKQDSDEKLEARVKSLESALASLRAELASLKAAKANDAEKAKEKGTSEGQLQVAPTITQEQIDAMINNALGEMKPELDALPVWVKKLNISGDLRYRHESIDSDTSGHWARGHNRNRIRARLSVDAQVDDAVDVGFRVASGSSDPASSNQTLADSFSSKELWLDLAYFDWHPTGVKGLNTFGGKMKNPFYKAGKNQLIWDGDVNPEGVAARYVIRLGDHDKLNVTGGGFWVDESSGGVDTSLWGVQTYLKHDFENNDYVLGGASYFDYGNIRGRGDLKSTWSSSASFFGNSATGSTFDDDFDIFEAFAEYGFKLVKAPASVFGDYVKNRTATSSKDTGWLVGFKFNKAKNPGSWELSYDYRDIEADAALGSFTDSDFIGGGTNGRGHSLGFRYQMYKNVQAALTSFINKRGNNNDRYRRLQADMICKF